MEQTSVCQLPWGMILKSEKKNKSLLLVGAAFSYMRI